MGRKAKGTLLQIGDGAVAPAVEAFTSVAELTSIPFPEFGEGSIDTTSFDSGAEEFEPDGIQQHGEPECEGNWLADHATQNETAGLLKKALAGGKHNFKVVVSAGAGTKTVAFGAIVRFMPSAVAPRDPLRFRVRFRISGAVTIT